MRRPRLATLVVGFGVLIPPVHARTFSEQALTLLRVASAQSAIITFCAEQHAIDGTTALRIAQTARDVAGQVLGRDRANDAPKNELARRFDEVKEVGGARWCADQRAAFSEGDVPLFKN